MIQVNKTDLYVIGGDSYCPSLVAGNYSVPESCFKIDISNGHLTRKADMFTERYHFAMTNIGHRIYIFGGFNPENRQCLQACERFNMLTNTWVSHRWSPLPD